MSLDRFDRFRDLLVHAPALGFWLDVSRIRFADGFFAQMDARIRDALRRMTELEAGATANPDEGRLVGHYWLRAPALAPKPEIRADVERTLERVLAFAADVHAAHIRPERSPRFRRLVVVGIGGSALGPQLAAAALGSPADRMIPHFFDNTDPDGFDRVLDAIGDDLGATLAVIVSKSGGTKETRNGMLALDAAYRRLGLTLGAHAVAVTGEGSELDKYAAANGFLARFPMWDWVGGRTSELSAVGLLPAALQGLDVRAMLAGAAAMDEVTRAPEPRQNPAAVLALAWYSATGGAGKKDMVVLPYKDRLELFSRYLQQLVMESLGKQHDLDGKEVFQGIAVYGNKGSTDQHAYVQQLRDGVDNFFTTFIEVLRDHAPGRRHEEVEPGVTAGDYLSGFLQGTRQALTDRGRESITVTIEEMGPRALGALIALYERAVGLYAWLVNVNAYHQPGVEAGKKAAQAVITLQGRVFQALSAQPGRAMTVQEIAKAAGESDPEPVFWILRRLVANPERGVVRDLPEPSEDGAIFDATYRLVKV
ncbi:glucose-6-phosphate isomerase [Chondromyces apiculatus]|uniref:Glucose-6-phosphate isomerase n=1 Tax=Chondromyces apiculatus DSM 436 TaxID=1192034 RepID=A0A017TIC6_9BACT|nr:glucose-6-phosphate isomerase [Chondromyces apiculatus]EYF08575.1 Glucose-6-phosphate isomerase [Chondromyces apiculatus DSM 436]